jgi:arylsulfatase A-like enzyme
MKPTLSLLTALLFSPLTALHAGDLLRSKPNIVLILVDDMPYAGPSVTGNKLLRTPHMDRIAKEGILFSRAYTESLCGPSRATLMTGQFAGRHGHTDNVPGVHPYALMREPLAPLPNGTLADGFAGEATAGARLPDPIQHGGYSLVQALKAGGYRTTICGKWHLPLQHLTPKLAPRYGFDFCTEKPDRSQPYRDTKHFTDDAIQFLRDNRAQSFFLYLPYVAVHGGHVVPPEDQARWKERLRGKNVGIDPDMLASLEFVDLFPTLCDAAGVKPDPTHNLDGTSLRQLFTGGTLPDRALFATYPHYIAEFGTTPVRAAIQNRYKLVWYPYDHIEIAGDRVTSSTIRYVPKPRVELFDIESDPGEHDNIADKYPEKVSELKSLLETWMKQTGAKDLTPNPAYDASRPLFNTRDEALKKDAKK